MKTQKTIVNKSGFTIVELLIVIVVIGILAAIVIVAYNGIQNNAYNNSVKSDLAGVAKVLEMYRVESTAGQYPLNTTEITSMQAKYPMKASKSAYTVGTSYNFVYCIGGSPNGSAYGVAAQARSGTAYFVSNNSGGVQEFASWGPSAGPICTAIAAGLSHAGWGYRGDGTGWQSWIAG